MMQLISLETKVFQVDVTGKSISEITEKVLNIINGRGKVKKWIGLI